MSTETSFRLSKALANGRDADHRADSREAVLARLLAKRAAAHRAGLKDLEDILRSQIEWALPMHKMEGNGRKTKAS
ncbi:hypothetical protein [Parasphingopyxis sp.]|uniref:hypothetical protein n=1 Tax=Parasphingopyxis sp. TaxID=1920299 RepID=UPI0026149071|nr:hypothetical protein [Parasphingopyxis sp.]